jgi:hypothetical protein
MSVHTPGSKSGPVILSTHPGTGEYPETFSSSSDCLSVGLSRFWYYGYKWPPHTFCECICHTDPVIDVVRVLPVFLRVQFFVEGVVLSTWSQ